MMATTTTRKMVFPYVSFTSIDDKKFVLARDRIKHCETYETNEQLDHEMTFINFESPNPKSKGLLHAVVDMPLEVFTNEVLRPAYEGD